MIRRARPWLGTIVEIACDNEAALEAGFGAIARCHAAMSFHSDDGDLAALRNAPAGTLVAVDPQTVNVLRLAARLHDDSEGLFDVTVGRTLVAAGYLPRNMSHRLTHYSGSAADIEIVDASHVRCHRPMLIDLGGIAKGHAVDMAVAALQAAGATQGIVNAGGDLRVFGEMPETVWLRGADGTLVSSIVARDEAVASSSNSLFRRQARGRQVSPHIGRAGLPVISDHTATVIAPDCAMADAMTKIAMADRALAEHMLAALGGRVITTVSTPVRQAA